MTTPEPQLQVLVLGGDDWREAAACREVEPDLHHGGPDTSGRDRGGIVRGRIRRAVRVCNGDPDTGQPPCPVRDACLLDAFSIPAPYEQAGVWGGLVETERRRLVRANPGASPVELLILARAGIVAAGAPAAADGTVECERPGCSNKVPSRTGGKPRRYCGRECSDLAKYKTAPVTDRTVAIGGYCMAGHERTVANTLVRSNGKVVCRQCKREGEQRRRKAARDARYAAELAAGDAA